MRWKCSKQAKHIQTTSLQLVPDARDLAVEGFSQASSVRPHTSSLFHFQVTLQEVSGKLMAKFTLHFKSIFQSFGEARI